MRAAANQIIASGPKIFYIFSVENEYFPDHAPITRKYSKPWRTVEGSILVLNVAL